MHRYTQYPAGQPSAAAPTVPGNASHSIYGAHPAQVPRSFSSPYYLRNSYQMSPGLPKSRSATSVQSMVATNTALPPKGPPDRYHRRRSAVLETSLQPPKPRTESPTVEAAPRQKLLKVHSDTSATIGKHHHVSKSETSSISKAAAKQAASQHRPRPSTKPPQKRPSVQQRKFDC